MSKKRPMRKKLSPKKSKKLFTQTAKKVHPKNDYRPFRGGIQM